MIMRPTLQALRTSPPQIRQIAAFGHAAKTGIFMTKDASLAMDDGLGRQESLWLVELPDNSIRLFASHGRIAGNLTDIIVDRFQAAIEPAINPVIEGLVDVAVTGDGFEDMGDPGHGSEGAVEVGV